MGGNDQMIVSIKAYSVSLQRTLSFYASFDCEREEILSEALRS